MRPSTQRKRPSCRRHGPGAGSVKGNVEDVLPGEIAKLDPTEEVVRIGTVAKMLSEGEETSMQDQGKIKKTDPDKKYRRVLAASTLAGDQVQNSAGEDLGKVDEYHDRHSRW